MIVGEPGDRKSTAIKLVKDLCEMAGYNEFAFDSGSKESYFESLSKRQQDLDIDLEVISNDWTPPLGESHSFICNDEFDLFIGTGNLSFISALGDLWDRKKDFRQETKKGGVVLIRQPYITILGGTTAETFSSIFPATLLGRGFLSRLLLIPCKGLERKLALPEPPPEEDYAYLIESLKALLYFKPHELKLSPKAKEMYVDIYNSWKNPFDSRFAGYASRRHVHFLKLSLIFAVLNQSPEIDYNSMLKAHSLLLHTESLMPNVIGELGKGPNSVVMSEIMNTLDKRVEGLTPLELYKLVHRNVRNMDEVNNVLNLLKAAGRVVTKPDGRAISIPIIAEVPKNMKKYYSQEFINLIK